MSSGLSRSIMANVPMTVTTEETSCTRLWLMHSLRASTSFVYRLISSPWVWVSKKLTGRSCIWLKRSALMVFSVFCETWSIMRE